MSITDNVINIALLGTANREMTSGELPEDLAGTLERVKENATDGEEVFYKGAAAFFAYYRSGLEPLKLKDPVPVSEAGPEMRPYVGQKAAAILSILLWVTGDVGYYPLWDMPLCRKRMMIRGKRPLMLTGN